MRVKKILSTLLIASLLTSCVSTSLVFGKEDSEKLLKSKNVIISNDNELHKRYIIKYMK